MFSRVPEILIVEDEPAASALLENYLTREGWRVQAVSHGNGVAERLAREPVDLVFLDRRLPDGDSLMLCRQIRSQSAVGIIFTTAVNDEVERLIGLENGADAYFSKPLPMRELLATSRNLIDRVRANSAESPPAATSSTYVWHFGHWTFDPFQHALVGAEDRLQRLTKNECRLLLTLVEQPGRFLTRDELLVALYQSTWCENTRTIDVLIGRLRRKLREVAGNAKLIQSQYGGGYMFSIKGQRVDETPG